MKSITTKKLTQEATRSKETNYLKKLSERGHFIKREK